jgi:hypothetical protein
VSEQDECELCRMIRDMEKDEENPDGLDNEMIAVATMATGEVLLGKPSIGEMCKRHQVAYKSALYGIRLGSRLANARLMGCF